MSYTIGMDLFHLRPTPRLGHTEYCDHEPYKRDVCQRTGKSFADAWEFDFLWCTDDGPVPWSQRGRVTDMGHAVYMEGGRDYRESRVSPFSGPEDVLAFDAVREYGLLPFDDLVRYYEESFQRRRAASPDQVCTGGYYKTIVSGAIDAFGWDLLLEAAADQDGFEQVLDSIFRLSLHHYRAWAETSIDIFICHDDMVWTCGPFVSPKFYRKVIFPRYRQLWQVLKERGKKVIFCSDGDFGMFADDIVAAGADGLIFEPMMALDPVVAKYGQSHVIVASKVDCRTMTFGTRDAIRAEIDATMAIAKACPGFFLACGNHLPANIPAENLDFYIDYLRETWWR